MKCPQPIGAPEAPSEVLQHIIDRCTGGAYPGENSDWRSEPRPSGRYYGMWLYAHAPRRWRGPWTARELRLSRVCRTICTLLIHEASWNEVMECALAALQIDD